MAAGLAALAVAGCASQREQIVGRNWAGPRATPSDQEFTPERAIRHQVSGWVVLRCVAGQDVSADNCFVIAETPEGWGFGEAALRTSRQVQVHDATHFGGHVPVAGEAFNLPIVFCPPAQPACADETRTKLAAFDVQMKQSLRLLRAKDCAAAVATATDTGVAFFVRLVAAECAKQR